MAELGHHSISDSVKPSQAMTISHRVAQAVMINKLLLINREFLLDSFSRYSRFCPVV
jgi:hypothetical protein